MKEFEMTDHLINTDVQPEDFQAMTRSWVELCFGRQIADDPVERGDRLAEEVLELLQAVGYDRRRIFALVDYVWSRPVGEPEQEVGGVMVTLAAFCAAHGIDMRLAGETELLRILSPEIIEKIRGKQAKKDTGDRLRLAEPTGWVIRDNLSGKTRNYTEDFEEARAAEAEKVGQRPVWTVVPVYAAPDETEVLAHASMALSEQVLAHIAEMPDEVARRIASCTDVARLRHEVSEAVAPMLDLRRTHSDDIAVSRFAIQMRHKMARSRMKGRDGWDDPALCSDETLARLFMGHVQKSNAGNYADLANFCMMLYSRGARMAAIADAHAEDARSISTLTLQRCATRTREHGQAVMDFARNYPEGSPQQASIYAKGLAMRNWAGHLLSLGPPGIGMAEAWAFRDQMPSVPAMREPVVVGIEPGQNGAEPVVSMIHFGEVVRLPQSEFAALFPGATLKEFA